MRKGSKLRLVILALGALAALFLGSALVGCGDNDDSSPLTKAEFVKQGNLICQKWEQEREEEYEKALQSSEGKKPTPQTQEKAAVDVLQRPYERMASKLAELSPPEGEEKQVEAIVQAMEEAISKIEKDPASALREGSYTKPNKLATDYGLTECSA